MRVGVIDVVEKLDEFLSSKLFGGKIEVGEETK